MKYPVPELYREPVWRQKHSWKKKRMEKGLTMRPPGYWGERAVMKNMFREY